MHPTACVQILLQVCHLEIMKKRFISVCCVRVFINLFVKCIINEVKIDVYTNVFTLALIKDAYVSINLSI